LALISNTDDHLRNYGFPYESNQDWRLSLTYVLNPIPVQFWLRILSTLIDKQSGDASIELALSVAEYFRLALLTCTQSPHRSEVSYLTATAEVNRLELSSSG
jgi:hypothetical protein